LFVVEDTVAMRTALSTLFGPGSGFEVVGTASNEYQATEWLLAHPGGWDAACVDLVLAEGSGYNVIHRLRQQHPEGTIVVFSAFVSEGVREHCLRIGADAVFAKTEIREFASYFDQLRDRQGT
jgi:DNA-binding NarL/FixJ family response regulator